MFAKQTKQSIKSWTISLGALVLAAAPAFAQPGQSGPLWNYRSNYGNYDRSSYSAPATPVFDSAPATTSESYYNGPAQNDGRVLIQMHVPQGAKVWFGDTATTQTGANRQFISPGLAQGQSYSYQIRVQWQDAGQAKEQTRNVPVRAGDRINLEFGGTQAQ